MTTLVFKTTDDADSYFANGHKHLDKKDLQEYRWILESMIEGNEDPDNYREPQTIRQYHHTNSFWSQEDEITYLFQGFCEDFDEAYENDWELYDVFFKKDEEDFDDLTDGLDKVIVKGDTQIARLNRLIDFLVKEKGEHEILALIDKVYERNHEYTESEILGDYFIQDYSKGEWKSSSLVEHNFTLEVISNIPIKGREKMDAGDLYSECEAFMKQWMEDNDKEDLDEFPYEYYDSVDGRLR